MLEHFLHLVQMPSGMSFLRTFVLESLGFLAKVVAASPAGCAAGGSCVSRGLRTNDVVFILGTCCLPEFLSLTLTDAGTLPSQRPLRLTSATPPRQAPPMCSGDRGR